MFSFLCGSNRDVISNLVKPELLCMELSGGIIADDDYLAKSYKYLTDIPVELPQATFVASDGLPLRNLKSAVEPNYSGMKHGFVRMNDWTWYFVGTTNLRTCTGEMFKWWFSQCDNPEKFKWGHPINNIEGEYDPTFYATQPEDRKIVTHLFTS
jgi:hypothetical protein